MKKTKESIIESTFKFWDEDEPKEESEVARKCKEIFNLQNDLWISLPSFPISKAMQLIDDYEDMIQSNMKQAANAFQLQQELIKSVLYHPYLEEDLKEKALKVHEKIQVELTHYKGKMMLIIHYDDLLPIFHRGKKNNYELYLSLNKSLFIPMSEKVARCLRENKISESLFSEKVCVACVQYYPDKKVRDLDNHIYYFIYNTLRYAQVCQDDNWRRMVQLQDGKLSEDGSKKTKIYVFPLKILPQFSSEYLI